MVHTIPPYKHTHIVTNSDTRTTMSTNKPTTPISSPKLLHPPTMTSIIQPVSPPTITPTTPPPPHSRTKRRSYGVFESPDRQKDGNNNTNNDLLIPALPFTPSTKRRSYGLFDSPVGKSPYGAALKTPRNEDYSPEQDDDKKLKLQKTPQFTSAKRLYDTLNSAISRSPNIFANSKSSINYREQLQSTSPTKVSPIKFPTTPSPPNSKHYTTQVPSLPFTPSTKRRSYGLFESPVSKSPSNVPLDTPVNDEIDAKEAIKKMLERRNGTSSSTSTAGVLSKPKVNPINLSMDKTNTTTTTTNTSSNNSTPTPHLPALKLPSLDSKFTEREAAFSLVKLQSVAGHEDDTETEDEDDF